MDETIFMCGIYDYRARRVLFAVQLQDRGEHRARYVTAHETFENVVITLFDFEQGTDANYHDCITSYFYSVWIRYFEPLRLHSRARRASFAMRSFMYSKGLL